MSRRPRLAVLALALAQVLVLTAGTATAARRWLAAPLDGDDAYVLLVLGSDQGPPRAGAARTGRADGFHLLVVDATRTRVSILSFPRDSYVEVPGAGRRKINASLTRGPEAAVATAEKLTGLEVDDWILTGFHGLIAAVDELGGLELEVEQRLYDPTGASTDLHPGRQRLSGWQTLAYTRDRNSRASGDFGRTESHARVLQAAHAQLRGEAPDAARIAALVGILRRHTETSIRPGRLFRLAGVALTIAPEDVVRVRAPGRNGRAGEAAVVHLDAAADELFDDLRRHGVLDGAVP